MYALLRNPNALYTSKALGIALPSSSFRSCLPDELLSIADALPTATHAFAFSILTALFFPPCRETICRCCLFWARTDNGFEFLQMAHSCPAMLATSDYSIARIACADMSKGVFDWLDIFSACLGAAIAYSTLIWHVYESEG
jgi:hypothetical protein